MQILIIFSLLIPLNIITSSIASTLPIIEKTENKNSNNYLNKFLKEFEKANETNNYRKAIKLHKKILKIEINQFGPETKEVALRYKFIGENYGNLGIFDESFKYFKKAIAILKKLENRDFLSELDLNYNLGLHYEDTGNLKKAEKVHFESINLIKKNNLENKEQLLVDVYDTLSRFYAGNFQFGKANNILNLALKINDEDTNLLTTKAILLNYEKKYIESIEILEKVLQEELKKYETNAPEIVVTRHSIAENYSRLGLYEKSNSILENILKIAGPSEKDIIFLSLGDNYSNLGNDKKALYFYKKALDIQLKFYGKNHRNTAVTYHNLGSIYERKENYKKAKNYYYKSINIGNIIFGKDNAFNLWTYERLGQINTWESKYDEAENLYKKALKISKEKYGDLDDNYPHILSQLSDLFYITEEDDKSYEFAKQALISDLKFLKEILPFLPLNLRSNVISEISLFDWYREYKPEQTKNDELLLNFKFNAYGFLQEIERTQNNLENLDLEEINIFNKIKNINTQLSSKNLSNEIFIKLEKEKSSLEKIFYKSIPRLKYNFVETKTISNLLEKNSILIEYIKYLDTEYKEGYLAILINKNGIIKTFDLGSSEIIDKKINEALIATERIYADSQELWDEVAKEVINPLFSIIKNYNNIYITPDGELNNIPFSIFRDIKKQSFLAENFNLRILTTGRDLLKILNDDIKTQNEALIVGNPNFNLIKNELAKDSKIKQKRSFDLINKKWNDLPGTKYEVEKIAKLTNGNLLTKNKANSIEIERNISPKILHIASHSYFLENLEKNTQFENNLNFKENPLLRSGIVLAGANRKHSNNNSLDDGYLTALEITNLNWDGTELVVISGCSSGKGLKKTGEGVYGLNRAIIVAGAKSSLLSLWDVDDKATALFMENFYIKLKNGISRSKALYETQKEFRNHPIEAWRHPNVWAAFQLSGDWRPIDF